MTDVSADDVGQEVVPPDPPRGGDIMNAAIRGAAGKSLPERRRPPVQDDVQDDDVEVEVRRPVADGGQGRDDGRAFGGPTGSQRLNDEIRDALLRKRYR